MTVRPFQASDEPKLRAIYQRRFPGSWRPLNDAIAAVVVVDANDSPVLLVAAHAVAEVRLSMDQEWGTPGLRQEAFLLAHDALEERLHRNGFHKAIAFLEPPIAKAFGRRLGRLRGWFASFGVAYEKES